MRQRSCKRHRFPADIIRHSVWLYARFTLRCRDAEEMLAERALDSLTRPCAAGSRSSDRPPPPIYAAPAPGPAIIGTSTRWRSSSGGSAPGSGAPSTTKARLRASRVQRRRDAKADDGLINVKKPHPTKPITQNRLSNLSPKRKMSAPSKSGHPNLPPIGLSQHPQPAGDTRTTKPPSRFRLSEAMRNTTL